MKRLAVVAAILRRLDTAVRATDPHPYAVDKGFPVGCWCGRAEAASQHAHQVPSVDARHEQERAA